PAPRALHLLRRSPPPPRSTPFPYTTLFRSELGRRLGHDLGSPRAEDVWDELRSLSPMHAGMSYARLEELGGIQWPCNERLPDGADRKSTRLNSSHQIISYAVFCLKKKDHIR